MYKIDKQFKQVNQLIQILKWFLIVLLLIVAFTELRKHSLCWSISCISIFFNHLATITTKAMPLLAALLATFVADRHIVFTSKNRDYDQAFEVTQITHRYIATLVDLRNKLGYMKKMFSDGGHYIHSYTTLVSSIEKRYESLLDDKEAFKYVHGTTIDKINSLSASIFALKSYVATLEETAIAQSNQKFPPSPSESNPFDNQINTIELILDELEELKNNVLKQL